MVESLFNKAEQTILYAHVAQYKEAKGKTAKERVRKSARNKCLALEPKNKKMSDANKAAHRAVSGHPHCCLSTELNELKESDQLVWELCSGARRARRARRHE